MPMGDTAVMFRKLLGAFFGLAMMGVVGNLGFVSAASATPILYDINFTITSGPAIDITGSFSIEGNDFTGSGFEEFGPDGAPSLLSLDMVIDPDGGGPLTSIAYMASDDILFDQFPVARFQDGVLVEIDFAANIDGNEILIGLGPTLTDELDWIFRPATGEQSSGTYFASIPEPSSMLLFGAGLIGLVGIGQRRRKQTNSV